MKKVLLLVVLFVFFLTGFAYAQIGVLDKAVTLSVPTATKISIQKMEINPISKTMTVTYRWIAADGTVIRKDDSQFKDHIWSCRDIPAELAANCTAIGEPYAGCTGAGTGVGLFAGKLDYTDTFLSVIKSTQAGDALGKSLRNLILTKMKSSVKELKDIQITFDVKD
jgi:hypothetical protein